MRSLRCTPMLLLLLTAACSDTTAPPSTTGDLLGSAAAAQGSERLVVMTQNLFVGADVDAVLLALGTPDPADDFPTLLSAIQQLDRTHFPSRAAALADQIARYRPHAVGLQEVSNIQIVLPPFGLNVRLEFLPILQQALSARGLDYAVAAQVQNLDATPAAGIRLIDYDVLLVDASRVTVHSSSGQNFTNNVGPIAPGVSLIRGWVSASVTIGGSQYTIVSTHPEPDLGTNHFSLLRAAQLGEILAALATTSPLVVIGDLNDDPGSPMYQLLLQAGFSDVWAALRPGAIGYTCCHAIDLSDQVARFDQQRDYVFVRGFEHVGRTVMGQITRYGMLPSDRVDGPLGKIWISDHAGVVATLLLPPGPPER